MSHRFEYGGDPREDKLPNWAKELIADLRRRIQYGNEPLINEIAKLRPQMEKMRAQHEAMTELLECAARGGHKTAQEIIAIIQAYDLTLTKKDN